MAILAKVQVSGVGQAWYNVKSRYMVCVSGEEQAWAFLQPVSDSSEPSVLCVMITVTLLSQKVTGLVACISRI
jgi:hypothetical protein